MNEYVNLDVKKYIYAKELLFILILYMGWIGCAVMRQLGMRVSAFENLFEKGILALYVGIPLGVGIGFIITKGVLKLLKPPDNSELYEAERRYGQSLSRFCVTSTCAALGVLGAISVCSLFDAKSVPLIGLLGIALTNGVLGSIGGLVGYILATAIYLFLYRFVECLTEQTSRPHGERQPLMGIIVVLYFISKL